MTDVEPVEPLYNQPTLQSAPINEAVKGDEIKRINVLEYFRSYNEVRELMSKHGRVAP